MKSNSDTLIAPKALTATQIQSAIGRVVRYASRRTGAWLAAIVAILLATLASSLTLQAIQPLLDVAVPKAENATTRADGIQQIVMILIYMIVLTLLGTFLMRQGRAYTAKLAQTMMVEFRTDFYHSLTKHNPSFFRRHEASELVSIGMSDIEVISVFLTQHIPFLLVNAGMLILAVIFMLLLSWQLALASILLVGFLQWLSLSIFIPQMQKVAAKYRRLFADASATLGENLNAVRDIQLFVQEDRTVQGFNRQLHTMAGEMTQNMELTVSNTAVFYALSGLGLALIYGVGAFGTINNLYDLGLLVSFAGFFSQFVAPITAFGNALGSFQSSLVSAHRVLRLMDVEAEITEKPEAMVVGKFKGHIKFENVNFSYEFGSNAWRMKNISFEILPGEKVAIVGGSGTGKTTLFNLIARFYDVTSGRVTIDGYDVRDLKLSSLRGHLGWVAQDVVLFRGTIADNLRFANPNASNEEIKKAAEVSHIEDFVEKMPDGYNSMIGEMGDGLSGGQKQRLSIARAALADPSILLLDEATSALDNRSQTIVMRSLDTLTRGRTSLNIAHRLSTIVNADKIIVLGFDADGGVTVKGIGQHQELIESCEDYFKLYSLKVATKSILMPIGPMYNTVPVLPTVIGLATAYNAPVYVLDFGEITAEALRTGRFGIEAQYDEADPKTINAKHHERVDEVMRILQGEGIVCDVLVAHAGANWIDETIHAIDHVKATHVVAMENVLIPLDELRSSIRTIERKATVDYILVNPLVSVMGE
ncbi:MAG: ABC transporter ATP-binding protein [Chloroflexi bacterium]|nr:ABC transporter ATP-binding protein [Chloroflexota bacterium]MBI5080591.1 ABC transporter ATP-binding protein [Chloroflexota bacterium]